MTLYPLPWAPCWIQVHLAWQHSPSHFSKACPNIYQYIKMHPASAFLVCSFTSPLCRKFMKGVSKSPLNVLLGFVFLCTQLPSEGCKHRSLAHVRWCFLLDYSPEEALASFPSLFWAIISVPSTGAELPAAWLHSELPLAVRHAWELLMAQCRSHSSLILYLLAKQ